MTYKTYLRSSIVLFSLFTGIYLSYEPLRTTTFVQQAPSLLTVLLFTQVVLAVSGLSLSIYAYIKKIEALKQYGRPITLFGTIVSSVVLLCAVTALILRLTVM